VSELFCFYATMIAACMIRYCAFQPLVSAFDNVDLPMGKNTDPRYDDHVQETRRRRVRNFSRAVNIVLSSDFDEFEARLVDNYEIKHVYWL